MRLFRYLLRKYFIAWAYLLATNIPFVHAENDFHAVENLVQTACISCHDAETETHLNLNAIDKEYNFLCFSAVGYCDMMPACGLDGIVEHVMPAFLPAFGQVKP